jgi:hypothetical protein
MRILYFIVVVIYVVLFTACSSKSVTLPSINKHGGLTTFTTTENVENGLIKTSGSSEQFCAGRESDAVSTEQSGLSLGIGMGGNSESVGATSGGGALSLGGRDPLVLITREFMYRACEFSLNHNLDKDQALDLYKHFLDKLIEIAPLTQADGTTSEGITTTAPLQQESKLSEKESSSKSSKKDIKEDISSDFGF